MNHNELIKKAWARYYSDETREIADYTKYDALYDVTYNMDISDDEYEELLDEMECF